MNDTTISRALAPSFAPAKAPLTPARDAELKESARAFETVFVAQMLSYSGFSEALSANGGFGGEAFAGLLVEQYAAELVERGGFGVADMVYEQLRDKEAANGGVAS
ncbi:MAG: rod-binding protein [Amphiplicatus sp.]